MKGQWWVSVHPRSVSPVSWAGSLVALRSNKLGWRQSFLSTGEVCGGRLAADGDRHLLDKEIKGSSGTADPPPGTSSKVISVVREYFAEQSEAPKNLTSPHITGLEAPGTYSEGMSPACSSVCRCPKLIQGLRSCLPRAHPPAPKSEPAADRAAKPGSEGSAHFPLRVKEKRQCPLGCMVACDIY